jgi:hypothetical protein
MMLWCLDRAVLLCGLLYGLRSVTVGIIFVFSLVRFSLKLDKIIQSHWSRLIRGLLYLDLLVCFYIDKIFQHNTSDTVIQAFTGNFRSISVTLFQCICACTYIVTWTLAVLQNKYSGFSLQHSLILCCIHVYEALFSCHRLNAHSLCTFLWL